MPWIVWLLLVVVALALGLALGWYLSSLEPTDDQALWRDPHVLDEQQWPARAQRRLIEVMPYAMLVLSGQGLVRYLSPDAERLGIVEHDRLVPTELMDMLGQVAADGRQREREIHIEASPLHAPDRGSIDGDSPHMVEFVKVRIGAIDEDTYAMFITDVTEQRRFASVRRDFVTNVSHELKTPAGAISLLAETMADAADDPDAVRYFAGRMTVESQRLTQLVYRLIDLQRVENLGAVKDLAPVSVIAVCRDAMSMNLTQAQSRRIALHLVDAGTRIPVDEHASRGPWAKANREALTTAVKNLVENAIRYSPEHATVNVDVRVQNDKVLIRVIDCGIGIPKEALGRIFERFYRVDAARSRDTGGSGLGLAIAKHCVEECDGTLSVWSHEHLGSTFTITLSSVRQPKMGTHVPVDADHDDGVPVKRRDEVVDDTNPDR